MSGASLRWRNRRVRSNRGWQLMSRLRSALLFIGWAALLLALVAVIRWYSPVSKPSLHVLYATYDGDLVPDNRTATNDAEQLSQLIDQFKLPHAPIELSTDSLASLQEELASLELVRSFFFPGVATEVFYVNASGIAYPLEPSEGAVPVLMTNGFKTGRELVDDRSAPTVPLSELVDGIVDCEADCKIVVLDCQKAECNWTVGVHSNEFVESATALFESRAGDLGNTFVLFSCGPGQISWSHESAAGTVFGSFFAAGIQGAADGSLLGDPQDGRITLDEQFTYVKQQVSHWVKQYRDDHQTPVLLSFGTLVPGEVILSTASANTDDSAESEDAEQPAEDQFDLARLSNLWQRVFELAASPTPPQEYAPLAWSVVLDHMMRAELGYRRGDAQGFNQHLDAAEAQFQTVQQLRTAPLNDQIGFSLPMLQFIGRRLQAEPGGSAGPATPADAAAEGAAAESAPEAAAGGTATEQDADAGNADTEATAPADSQAADSNQQPDGSDPPAPAADPNADPAAPGQPAGQDPAADPSEGPVPISIADVNRIVQTVLQGGSLAQAEQALTAPVAVNALPQSAELIRMLGKHSRQLNPPPDRDQARELLQSRFQLETLLFTPQTLTPQVVPWVRSSFDLADRAQRDLEDRLWSGGGGRLATQRETAVSVITTTELADEVATMTAAVRLWNRLMLEMPYLLRVAAVRPVGHDENDQPLPESVRGNLLDSLDELSELTQLIRATDSEISREQMLTAVQTASELTTSLDQRYRALSETIVLETQRMSARLGIQSDQPGRDWRRYSTLMLLPFAHGDAVAPKSAADRRIEFLLELVKLDQAAVSASSETLGVAEKEILAAGSDSPRQVRAREMRELGEQYFALGLLSPEITSSEPKRTIGYSGRLEALVQAGIAALQSERPARTFSQLNQRDLWSRLLSPSWVQSVFGESVLYPTQLYRRQQLAELYRWLAFRTREDFWGTRLPTGEHYFEYVTQLYLKHAEQLMVVDSRSIQRERERLEARAEAARAFRTASSKLIVSEPPRNQLIGEDRQRLTLSLNGSNSLPEGLVRIECVPANSEIRVERVPSGPTSTSQITFDVVREAPAAVSEAAVAKAFYRGHQRIQPIPISAVSELDAPTVEYLAAGDAPTSIRVRWSKLDRKPANILFVLDCSRSMNIDGRISILRSSLLRFAEFAGQSGMRVGVRVFGDRVIWKRGDRRSELDAQQDTRLILPIQPFTGNQFDDAVSSLAAHGESPLFRALIDAREDFNGLPEGDNLIVVVSDGADNWAGTPRALGITELESAYANSGVRISAIGFQTDAAGFSQLQQISAVTGGTAVRAEQGDELLERVFGLTDFMTYSVRLRDNGASGEAVHTGMLQASPQPLVVSPGTYDVEVSDIRGNVQARRTRMVVRAKQQHELVYLGSKLAYSAPQVLQDVAFAEDEDTGVLLRILHARPTDDGRLEFEAALQNRLDPDWWPDEVQLEIRPRGTGDRFVIRGLTPNGTGRHFPSWKVKLSNWPSEAAFADVSVRWSAAGAASDQFRSETLDFTAAESAALDLTDGFRITRRHFQRLNTGRGSVRAARLTLVNTQQPESVAGWAFGFGAPVKVAQYTYDVQAGLCSAIVQFADNAAPTQFTVLPPVDSSHAQKLDATFEIRLRRIN